MTNDMVEALFQTPKNKNWKNKLDTYKLDPTLGWKFAEIQNLDDNEINFKIINEKVKKDTYGVLSNKKVKWALSNKKN